MVHHREIENTDNSLSGAAIGAAIAVHRNLGPGLLESVYQECLAHELKKRQISFAREVPVALQYESQALRSRLQLDFLIEERLVIETKSIEAISQIHVAQLLTYLRLSNIRLGLLINFNVLMLHTGIRRVVNG